LCKNVGKGKICKASCSKSTTKAALNIGVEEERVAGLGLVLTFKVACEQAERAEKELDKSEVAEGGMG